MDILTHYRVTTTFPFRIIVSWPSYNTTNSKFTLELIGNQITSKLTKSWVVCIVEMNQMMKLNNHSISINFTIYSARNGIDCFEIYIMWKRKICSLFSMIGSLNSINHAICDPFYIKSILDSTFSACGMIINLLLQYHSSKPC